ncbi:hypothetical protein SDC9_198920 [bioreactor metagenome]|uniref:Uncharacterized protein n=1 Tax=bioreactor metagenome TaxID=1076179 RepID=A0A645IJ12_9ZZZZ
MPDPVTDVAVRAHKHFFIKCAQVFRGIRHNQSFKKLAFVYPAQLLYDTEQDVVFIFEMPVDGTFSQPGPFRDLVQRYL